MTCRDENTYLDSCIRLSVAERRNLVQEYDGVLIIRYQSGLKDRPLSWIEVSLSQNSICIGRVAFAVEYQIEFIATV